MPDRTLYEWFARSVHSYPDAPALEIYETSHTYRELNQYAERVAERILDARRTPPDRVALLASRSLIAFAGYLAVQRLGAAVVPLNPGYPAARNQAVCSLAAVDVLVADESAVTRMRGEWDEGVSPGCTFLALTDDDAAGSPGTAPKSALPPYRATADDIAYVLFTSGSTGRPKGVPIRHRNVSPYLAHNIARFEVAPGCRTSSTFDLTFDPSVHDLFVTWGAGATLVAPQRDELLAPVDYLVRRGITHWHSVPSVVTVSAALGELPAGLVSSLRYSGFSGEQLTCQQAEAWHAVAPGTVIENNYGPTELTINCTGYRLPAESDQWPTTANDTVPIGPLHHYLDYVILDDNGNDAAEGELCVRGAQRFDGYLDPSDNNGRFVRHDAASTEIYQGHGDLTREHYFRTGDQVRREGGTLVHVGRLDNQVQIRGYRVELGEIEAALRRHPAVSEAVVIAVPSAGEIELVGCYTGMLIDRGETRAWLRKRIPLHMVPRRFEHLGEIPLNPNGKIDRPSLLRNLTEKAVG